MSILRERLISQYSEHYQRINKSIGAHDDASRRKATNDVLYGRLMTTVPASAKVLDLGCGTGIFLSWLVTHTHVEVVGVDQSAAQIELARQALPQCQLVCDDGLAFLQANPAAFGAIFCFDVLEHVPGNDLLLRWVESARQALRPGGFLVCRVPNAANLTSGYSRYIDLTHERIFTRGTLEQLLRAGGFDGVEHIPLVLPHVTGRMRQLAETALHRAVFLVCGRGRERAFTTNICSVGYRPPC